MARHRIEKQIMEIRHAFFSDEIHDLLANRRPSGGSSTGLCDDVIDFIWQNEGEILIHMLNVSRRSSSEWIDDATGNLTVEARDMLRSKITVIIDELYELQDLPLEKLTEHYKIEYGRYIKAKNAKRTKQGLENDIGARFNDLEAVADFAYWYGMDSWSIEEAAALSFGKDPRYVTAESLKPYDPVVPSAFRPIYGKWISLIERAVASEVLKRPMTPEEFIAWANAKIHYLPAEISTMLIPFERAYIKKESPSYKNFKKTYEDIGKIVDENVDLNQYNKKLLSMYKTIIGMAYARFGFCSGQRNGAAKLISDLIDEAGVYVNDDSVRGILQEALTYIAHWEAEPFKKEAPHTYPGMTASIRPKD